MTTTEEHPVTPAYLWFDSEFSRLDLDKASLLQVALMVTDSELKRLTPPEQDINLYIRLGADTEISDWVEQNQAATLEKCRSEQAVSLEEADRQLAALVDQAVGPAAADIKHRPVLSGNSIYMDMTLARKHLPRFEARLNYGLLDITTLKTLWKDWIRGPVFDKDDTALVGRYSPPDCALPPGCLHDAYYDIHASLAELHYYRRELIRFAVTDVRDEPNAPL